ncbi:MULTISPECIES: hypothetical protein [Halorubrum]|uniref:hypothetical protein n=1 Tax=Halorubrum TaxID=56688 RepID=UPI0010F6A0E5|nr:MULTISPECIES: hypothetical protein [Halorubrum]TKX72973.1 hypothetical protein EXE40_01475 [Halorubrum sp. GN11GM_10-3_MGM]
MPSVPIIENIGISPFYIGVISTTLVFLIIVPVWKKFKPVIDDLGEKQPVNALNHIRRALRKGWLRKGVLLAYGAILLASVTAVLELNQTIDLVPSQGDNQLTIMAPVFGAFGSIALSFGLVILYDRQARVLAQQYQPYLTGDLENRSAVTTQFVIRNTGEDYAHNITAEWEVAGETRKWETPDLAPGDTAAFPVVVDDDDGWIMNTDQIRDYLEDNGNSLDIDFTIKCEDQMDMAHTFSGTVDFGVMSQRQEASEIWEVDPIDSLASSAANIEASVDKIASDFDDRRDEQKWQNRWTKQQAIKTIVSETGTISISVLKRLVREKESSLEYRLSELEEAGYLVYNERSGEIRSKPSSRTNHTLSEFP